MPDQKSFPEKSVLTEKEVCIYGKVFSDLEATTLNPDASLRSLSEEIGWMEVSPEKIPAIGKKIRLLAQHAGTTIACNPRAWLIDGEKVIGPAVIRA